MQHDNFQTSLETVMAGVYGKHMHRITGMVGIDEGQPEQLAGNNTLEKKTGV